MHATAAATDAQYDPAGHAPATLTPAAQYVPVPEHAVCVAGVAQNEPAAHAADADVPSGQYWPTTHAVAVPTVKLVAAHT